jgi:hypothetical protein
LPFGLRVADHAPSRGVTAELTHDHAGYRGRVSVVLATYRASQRLGLEGVLSTSDLLRNRDDALRKLTELADPAELDGPCVEYREEALREISAS